MQQNPIFILGNPRSGTSLLRVIINAHPDILIPPECGFAVWLYDEFKNKDFERNQTKNNFIEKLIRTRKFETWKLNIDELKTKFLNIHVKNYADTVDFIYRFYGSSHSIYFKRWGDKNNFYLNNMTEINEIFPEAQFIHIVRDGRDVASSYIDISSKSIESKYSPDLPVNIKDIAIDWIRNNDKIIRSLSDVPEERKLLIRFEDVIQNFDLIIRKIIHFLGISYSEKMKNFQHSTNALEPDEFMQWKSKLYNGLDQSSIGRYKKDLSLEEVEIFNRLAGKSLRKYGYMV